MSIDRVIAITIVLAVCATISSAQDQAPVRLNNFVVQLADVDLTIDDAPDALTFDLDRSGWLFIELTGQGPATVALTSAGGQAVVVLEASGETMRHVPAGTTAITIATGDRADLERLVVHSIPEIMMYMYEEQTRPFPQRWITHSWDFLEEAILHSANLVVSHNDEAYLPYAERWQQRGGRWLINQGMTALRDPEVDLARHWADLLADAVWDGSIHDEVVPRDRRHFDRFADGLARFTAMPESDDRTVYLFCDLSTIGDLRPLDFYRPTDETSVHGTLSIRCMPQGQVLVSDRLARQLYVELEPGVEYTISAYMRTRGVVPARQSGVFLIDEGWRTGYGRMYAPEGDSDWTRYEETFTPRPSRNDLYQVILYGPASGDMWIDAVQVERGSQATAFTTGERNILENPSFENGMSRWLRGADDENPLRDAVIEHGHVLAAEMYMNEERTEADARARIHERLVRLPANWERQFEGVTPQVLIVMSVGDVALRYSNDRFPTVSYKVLLDMQMNALATGQGLEAVRGVGFWSAHYGSPEIIRWFGALFRHYCIEGNTERLSDDPYELDHLANPGFEDGLRGWATDGTVEPVRVADMPEGGQRGRWAAVPEGNMVIRTSRAPDAEANVFAQPIRNLEPGRAYSLKFYCTGPEYARRLIPADVTIEGAEMLPEHSWEHLWGSWDATVHWTMHKRVFRATGGECRLIISDAAPGEVYWDFVQVEPFFEG